MMCITTIIHLQGLRKDFGYGNVNEQLNVESTFSVICKFFYVNFCVVHIVQILSIIYRTTKHFVNVTMYERE